MPQKVEHVRTIFCEATNKDDIDLFSDKASRLTKSKIKLQFDIYHRIYNSVIPILAERMVMHLGVPRSVAMVYSRVGVINTLGLILSRTLRIQMLINEYDKEYLCIGSIRPLKVSAPSAGEIDSYARNSFEFNQSVLMDLSFAFNIPLSKKIYLSREFDFKQKNTIFTDFNFLYRLKNKIYSTISRIFPRNGIPTLSMANMTNMLQGEGFYLKYLTDITSLNQIKINPFNSLVRKKIFNNLDEVMRKDVKQLFSTIGDVHDFTFLDRMPFLLEKYFPLSLIEGSLNYKIYFDRFVSNRSKFLLSSSFGSDNDIYAIAAAKYLGIKVVNAQHGGHYGYIENISSNEVEIPLSDIFLSWGWDGGDTLNEKKIVVLPSPWLSVRKKYWKKEDMGAQKEFDVLFMSSNITRFPFAVMSDTALTSDLAPKVFQLSKKYIDSMFDNGARILHKPFNAAVMNIYPNLFDFQFNNTNGLYKTPVKMGKGLSRALVKKATIVVWDNPGTGFLECIACGIPTIVLWSGYSDITIESTPIFNELEKVGVIHREIESAIIETLQAIKDIQYWMNNSKRKAAISEFSNKFALTSDDWSKSWKDFLNDVH